jgi:hypothetical protein
MHQIGSRRVFPYGTAIATPACEDTGPRVTLRGRRSGGPVSLRAGYVSMHQIGLRRVFPYETAIAIPACEDTGPPGNVAWKAIRRARLPTGRVCIYVSNWIATGVSI